MGKNPFQILDRENSENRKRGKQNSVKDNSVNINLPKAKNSGTTDIVNRETPIIKLRGNTKLCKQDPPYKEVRLVSLHEIGSGDVDEKCPKEDEIAGEVVLQPDHPVDDHGAEQDGRQ
jgi:hypothetical protein